MPQPILREDVQVVLRDIRSTSPDCIVGPRSAAVVGRNSTALALPRTAAATARQRSMSKPTVLPAASTAPKPGRLLLLAQISWPRSLTAASLPPSCCSIIIALAISWARASTFASVMPAGWFAIWSATICAAIASARDCTSASVRPVSC